MLIKVIYEDESTGEVESYELDALIASRKIRKFRREGKWVTIGVDPIRKLREEYVTMPEEQASSGKKKKRAKNR